jgi:hypothetical protein
VIEITGENDFDASGHDGVRYRAPRWILVIPNTTTKSTILHVEDDHPAATSGSTVQAAGES